MKIPKDLAELEGIEKEALDGTIDSIGHSPDWYDLTEKQVEKETKEFWYVVRQEYTERLQNMKDDPEVKERWSGKLHEGRLKNKISIAKSVRGLKI